MTTQQGLDLHETFCAYVSAQAASTRTFIRYRLGDATEAEVQRMNAAEQAALNAHIEAMNAVATP